MSSGQLGKNPIKDGMTVTTLPDVAKDYSPNQRENNGQPHPMKEVKNALEDNRVSVEGEENYVTVGEPMVVEEDSVWLVNRYKNDEYRISCGGINVDIVPSDRVASGAKTHINRMMQNWYDRDVLELDGDELNVEFDDGEVLVGSKEPAIRDKIPATEAIDEYTEDWNKRTEKEAAGLHTALSNLSAAESDEYDFVARIDGPGNIDTCYGLSKPFTLGRNVYERERLGRNSEESVDFFFRNTRFASNWYPSKANPDEIDAVGDVQTIHDVAVYQPEGGPLIVVKNQETDQDPVISVERDGQKHPTRSIPENHRVLD
ncbi:MAG: hypothetical protein ABEJ03_02345 [Candidatus Nanohaloarchaea archaeon]